MDISKLVPTTGGFGLMNIDFVKDISIAAVPAGIAIFGVALGDIAAIVSISWIVFLAGRELFRYIKSKKET